MTRLKSVLKEAEKLCDYVESKDFALVTELQPKKVEIETLLNIAIYMKQIAINTAIIADAFKENENKLAADDAAE